MLKRLQGIYARSRNLLEKGRVEEAISLLREVLLISEAVGPEPPRILKPFLAEAHLLLGFCHSEKGELEQAVEEVGKALKLDPDNVIAHCELGYLYGKMGKPGEALKAFEEAAKRDSKCALALRGAAFWHARLGNVKEAMERLKQALSLDPNYGVAYAQLALTFEKEGDLKRAAECMRRAVKLCPDNPHYRLQLATILHRLGNPEEAAKEAEEAFKMEKSREAGKFVVRLLKEARKPERLIRVAREYLRKFPNDVEVLLELAQTMERIGNLGEAIRYMERAVEICPSDEYMRMYLASLYEALGDVASAMEEYQRVMRMLNERPPSPQAKRFLLAAAEAIRLLDRLQLGEIFRLARMDTSFRVRLSEDPQVAFEEKGFSLSNEALSLLQGIDWEDPSSWPPFSSPKGN